jgi:hypothetical protein
VTDLPEAEIAGIGDVRMVRTFRIGPDGELFPVNSAKPWTDGWNTAVCRRGRRHAAPHPECRCGFYVYSDPAYVLAQPPGRQVIAVVAVNGPMEAGTRGARVQRARVEAIWLGPRVRDSLAAAVAHRYPSTQVFRDRAAMDRQYPLTQIDGFAKPRVGERARRGLRYLTWAYLAAITLIGSVRASVIVASPGGAALWLAAIAGGFMLMLTALTQRSPVIALQGIVAVAWLVTGAPQTPAQWLARAALVVPMLAVAVIWWRAGSPGRRVHPPLLEALLGRGTGPRPDTTT